ncbi:Uncharacterised protein [Moraxella veridica]|uniref:Uncharacterized protein n=2 Tax=Moraxellaceae TaxID=468 RepID=A0A7Z0UZD9_MORCA|nr:hypothetical protein AO382_0733 [Moraxella catarrhalis]STY81648.1 Uncharacterised protein [Moraxella catarrhalis]
METMTNASYFIPGGKYLKVVTEPLAIASKIENEGVSKTVIGFGVSEITKKVVRTPQTSAIVDQLGAGSI